jgi:hypothetical protein
MLEGHSAYEVRSCHGRPAEADAAFDRAACRFEELAKRMGNDERACLVAGVALADYRCLRLLRPRRKRETGLSDTFARPILRRIMVTGAVMCAELPEPAND